MSINIEESWKNALAEEFDKPYFAELKAFLVAEKKARKTVFPPGKMIFNAFDSTPFNEVKVVIIGQDPYHGPGQAHGLCFSVQKGVVTPPSLRNMYKELKDDLDIPIPNHGNLQQWADQGVLLLNAILTVQAHEAASHRDKGWETFTDAAIRALNAQRENLVFLLWGSFAKSKASMIDISKHHILHTAHPSPLSAYRGFMGCKHFSKTNEILQAHDIAPVDWTVR